jgi:hypothetical protein
VRRSDMFLSIPNIRSGRFPHPVAMQLGAASITKSRSRHGKRTLRRAIQFRRGTKRLGDRWLFITKQEDERGGSVGGPVIHER